MKRAYICETDRFGRGWIAITGSNYGKMGPYSSYDLAMSIICALNGDMDGHDMWDERHELKKEIKIIENERKNKR